MSKVTYLLILLILIKISTNRFSVLQVMLNSKYIKELDGMRGLAILAVVIFHSTFLKGTTPFNNLFLKFTETFDFGVDFFFVISGFLITGILLNTKGKKNFFKYFYIRRSLRIFPLYYLVLIFTFLILPNFDHPRLYKWQDTDSFWYWTYLSNFYIASKNHVNHGLIDVSWSLSIEEQFYFIWPFLIHKFKKSNLLPLCLFLMALSFFIRALMLFNDFSPLQIHMTTFSRMEPLLYGSIIAIVRHSSLDKYIFIINNSLKIGITFLLLHFTINYILEPSSYINIVRVLFNYLLHAVIFGSFMIYLIDVDKGTFLKKIINNRILSFVGVYSYAIYLFHNPIQIAIRDLFLKEIILSSTPNQLMLLQVIFYIVVIFISSFTGYLSFHLYEKWFINLKDRFSFRS